jgi:two-component sensor histidine kinase/DNA-binding response OmpR family regulator
MSPTHKVNVLLVDDQPAKLLAYETILQDLGENLIKAASAREALEHLLKTEVAILLIDVCMPDLDGFELAAMIRQHPRFQQTAIIFVSAIHLSDIDRLKGYEMGAVDYVPVPVVPEVLRAKVRVFAELYRKTRQLEQLNLELERRVTERTAELEASNARLLESERRRSIALAAGQMGSWDWDVATGACAWDAGQYRIFGVQPSGFEPTFDRIRSSIHPEDLAHVLTLVEKANDGDNTFQTEVRIVRPSGDTRWCICAAATTSDAQGRVTRVSGVTIDITELKEAEARRSLLIKEVDHRARNVLAVVQSIVHLTRAGSIDDYVGTVEGRIRALATAHALLSESRWEGADLGRLVAEELAPYRNGEGERIIASGPTVILRPETAQTIALVLHELATNAAKYGALSHASGKVTMTWQWGQGELAMHWEETGGPTVQTPITKGFGTKVIAASVAQQLGGQASFGWLPSGLHFTMTAKVGDAILEPQQSSAKAVGDGKNRRRATGVVGTERRLLLVEDEALVGMMMKDTLTDLGFHVVGPFCKLIDAVNALKSEAFQAAVLDVNLRGDMIYSLADEIAGRGIPFVFVTGYGSDAIDARFANVPVLQKPVDRAALRGAFFGSERRYAGSVGA